jgi:hypothetical protein
MRAVSILSLCLVSAAVGAAVDHNWNELPGYWTRIRSFAGSPSPQSDTAAAKQSGAGQVEVLGDRVRCDVRYMELKIPESEYRAFIDKCMGNTGSTAPK